MRFTAGVWELRQRKTAELWAQTASFRDTGAHKPGLSNVGMTTETFSNRLKSHRKAEAFRARVIKMKQGRGKQMGEGMYKPNHRRDQMISL